MCLVNDTLQITNSTQMPFFYSHSFYRMIVFKKRYSWYALVRYVPPVESFHIVMSQAAFTYRL